MSQSQRIAIVFLGWFIATIANCGAIFMSGDGLYIACGVINFIVESYLLYRLCKNTSKE